MTITVPVSSDGSHFDPVICRRGGGYWVGPKGRQHKFVNYNDALAALRLMEVPYWRRPNLAGNWGIVRAAT
jgi:hypothetical protein